MERVKRSIDNSEKWVICTPHCPPPHVAYWIVLESNTGTVVATVHKSGNLYVDEANALAIVQARESLQAVEEWKNATHATQVALDEANAKAEKLAILEEAVRLHFERMDHHKPGERGNAYKEMRAALADKCGAAFWGVTGQCDLPKGHTGAHASRKDQ